MEDKIKEAPFTDDEVRILKLWQENEYLHPYTCCDGDAMIVENSGLKCGKCGNQQFWVHDFSLNERATTYNPFKNLKNENNE